MNQQQPAISVKTFQRGEVLLKASERIQNLFFLQSGRVAYRQVKNEVLTEMGRAQAPETVGEEALAGMATSAFTVVALEDTQALQVPVAMLGEVLKGGPQLTRDLLQGLVERLKVVSNEYRGVHAAREGVPCPSDHVAKVYGVIFHTAKELGREISGQIEVDLKGFRRYAEAIFLESPERLHGALLILQKLGYAEMDESMLRIKNPAQIEVFFDFYQHYRFKKGWEEFLRTNSKVTRIVETFLKVTESTPADRSGRVDVPYKPTIDAMKAQLGTGFEADQLFQIERKGLLIKRISTQDGGTLCFYRPDYEQMLLNWKFLREIEIWNEVGWVEGAGLSPERLQIANELREWKPTSARSSQIVIRTGAPKPGEVWCPVCLSVLEKGQKVCSVCGHDQSSGQSK